uniref:AlNc14C23G2375 protein n=1 Tax=Albugo laibachii Nc14 TaxID=890382 RepID=F0W676_9STRA|nr:AlNc14C23G2375 [Albugo laibachii Nc14]|eukprot:CCA16618.1 AlNc14C23G2375 [Albugo laibachii Nc14]
MPNESVSDAVADLIHVAKHLQDSVFKKPKKDYGCNLRTTPVSTSHLDTSNPLECDIVQQASKEDVPWIRTLSQKTHSQNNEEREVSDRILRRYQSLRSIIAKLREKWRKLAAEAASINDDVEKKLEEQESDWEKKMKMKGEQIERLKAILAESPCVSPSASLDENQLDEEIKALQEANLRRQSELWDLEATIKSVKTDRQCKRKRENLEALLASSPSMQAHEDVRKLCVELKTMLTRKKHHERRIERSEEVSRKPVGNTASTKISDSCSELTVVRTGLEKKTKILENLKCRLRSIIESHWDMLDESSIKSCILNSLYLHSGQISMDKLKENTRKAMNSRNRPCNPEEITRALYSLVAHDIIQIDRSRGEGLVTLLLM